MSDDGTNFARVLGRWDVLAVAFGAMIGFGWVVLTGDFLQDAGPLGAALAFAVGGLVVGLVGLTYAELVSAMPRAGGTHQYVYRAMGARVAFLASWALVLGYVSVVAFEAVALPESLSYIIPGLRSGGLWSVAGSQVHTGWLVVGIAAAVVVTALNYVGVRPAAVFQTIAVLFLLAVGFTLLLGSIVGGSASNMDPPFGGSASGIITVLVAVPFLFVGFDVIPQSAEEINLPFRQIGRLLIVSVAMAACWYMLIMLTVGSGLPAGELATSKLAAGDAMTALWHSSTMGDILVLGGIAGILSSWNGFLIGVSRLIRVMATSGMLPAWFGKLHPRYRTPSNALLFVGALSVLAPLFGKQMLTWLSEAGGLAIVLAYFAVAVSFLVLRHREPAMPRPFRIRHGTTVGVLAAVLSLGLITLFLPGMPSGLTWPYEWSIIGAWVVLGAVFFVRIKRPGPEHTATAPNSAWASSEQHATER